VQCKVPLRQRRNADVPARYPELKRSEFNIPLIELLERLQIFAIRGYLSSSAMVLVARSETILTFNYPPANRWCKRVETVKAT